MQGVSLGLARFGPPNRICLFG